MSQGLIRNTEFSFNYKVIRLMSQGMDSGMPVISTTDDYDIFNLQMLIKRVS